MKGSVTPVSGTILMTPPRIMKVCSASDVTVPTASSAWNEERARIASSMPRMNSSTYRAMTVSPTMMPNSSHTAENMKSLSTTGTDLFALPMPRPSPDMPPEAMAMSDWTIW